MRIRTTKTTNTVQYAIIKDITKKGKRTTSIFENLFMKLLYHCTKVYAREKWKIWQKN